MENFQYVVSVDTLQKLLKDILIPVIGFRDTSNSFMDYADKMTRIQQNLNVLNEPDTKKSMRADGTTSFYIEIPATAYHEASEFREPVEVELDINASGENYSMVFAIPAFFSQQRVQIKIAPWCISCNKPAFVRFQNVVIETLEKQGRFAYRIRIPALPKEDVTNQNYVTTYSENKDVRYSQDEFWSKITPSDPMVTVLNKVAVPLGAVTNVQEVPDMESLVYSNSIRRIENVTHEEMNLRLSSVPSDTKPDELYLLPEVVEGTPTISLSFLSKEEFLRRIPDLIRDYKEDWSRLRFHFGPLVTEIDDLFTTAKDTIVKAPFTISGANIRSAKNLFKDCTKLTHLPDSSVFFIGCPKLETVESAFDGCTSFVTSPEAILFSGCKWLWNLRHAFRGTKITEPYPFWTSFQKITNQYGMEEEIFMDGRGCFENCSEIKSSHQVPEDWKTYAPQFTFKKRVFFEQMLPRLLEEFQGDLSTISFTFGPETEINGLFRYSTIRKAPKEIIHEGTPVNASRMFEASFLEEISDTCLAKLPSIVSVTAMFKDCMHLKKVPKDLFAKNKAIVDYQYTFHNCINVTGATPKADNGMSLWSLAGQAGFPTTIYGTACFQGTTFEDLPSVPDAWK